MGKHYLLGVRTKRWAFEVAEEARAATGARSVGDLLRRALGLPDPGAAPPSPAQRAELRERLIAAARRAG